MAIRRNVVASALAAAIALPASASLFHSQRDGGATATRFPAAFVGKWREQPIECGDMTETGIDFGANTIGRYHEVRLHSVTIISPSEVRGLISGEEQTPPWQFHFRLSPTRDEMLEIGRDGTWLNLRRRCGAYPRG